MIGVTHLITGLGQGGAETMLAKLVAQPSSLVRHTVVTMTGQGPATISMADGIDVYDLDLSRGAPDPRAIVRLMAVLKKRRTDILQSWLYHADVLATIIKIMRRVPRLVWNIRCANLDMGQYSALSRMMPPLLARLSRMPDACIVNSEAGRRAHEALGYRVRRWACIPNGFDVDRFRPDARARLRFRREIGADEDTVLIGMPARVDPMKDYATFLAAAALVVTEQNPGTQDVRFVLVGDGTGPDDQPMVEAVRAAGLAPHVRLLGRRSDMPQVYAGLDIVCLSSVSEGFPNVLGEALACGVPCVATDVGDVADIVGEGGCVVPPRDPRALARAMVGVVGLGHDGRRTVGERGRRRIGERYDIRMVAARYEALYDELAMAV